MSNPRIAVLTLAASLAGAPALAADKISYKDPTGDDNGPGKYVYPTDTVYKKGSFDLTDFSVKKSGSKVDFTVGVNSGLEDPWRMGTGFSVQEVFVFIDTDGKPGSGRTDSPPGLNVAFDPAYAWDKVVIISPQGSARVKNEVGTKAGAMKDAVVVPLRVKGSGKKISATVEAAELGGDASDLSSWRYQVVMQSNEGFPSGNDLLTRRVNEFEGQHRFGGGTDSDCDPHVVDLLAGEGKGDGAEAKAQHEMLAYECAADGTASKKATLKMVGPRPAAAEAPAAPAPEAPAAPAPATNAETK
jgi:carbohydrate-binding DOMON domain-containing protein